MIDEGEPLVDFFRTACLAGARARIDGIIHRLLLFSKATTLDPAFSHHAPLVATRWELVLFCFFLLGGEKTAHTLRRTWGLGLGGGATKERFTDVLLLRYFASTTSLRQTTYDCSLRSLPIFKRAVLFFCMMGDRSEEWMDGWMEFECFDGGGKGRMNGRETEAWSMSKRVYRENEHTPQAR